MAGSFVMRYFCTGLEERLWRGCAFGTCAWRAVCPHSARAGDGEGDVSVSHFLSPCPNGQSPFPLCAPQLSSKIVETCPIQTMTAGKRAASPLLAPFPSLKLTLPKPCSERVPAGFAPPPIAFQKTMTLPASLRLSHAFPNL